LSSQTSAFGAIWGAEPPPSEGLNNIELITDRPLEVNLQEIKAVKRELSDRAMIRIADGALEEARVERDPAAWFEETAADGIELNSVAPPVCSERGMEAPWGKVPRIYRKWSPAGANRHPQCPVDREADADNHRIRKPAAAAHAGGPDAVSLDQHDQLHPHP